MLFTNFMWRHCIWYLEMGGL